MNEIFIHHLGFLNLGPTEIILILVVAVVLFGGKLPEVARSFGKVFFEFKRNVRDLQSDLYRSTDFDSRRSDYASPRTDPPRSLPEPYSPESSSDGSTAGDPESSAYSGEGYGDGYPGGYSESGEYGETGEYAEDGVVLEPDPANNAGTTGGGLTPDRVADGNSAAESNRDPDEEPSREELSKQGFASPKGEVPKGEVEGEDARSAGEGVSQEKDSTEDGAKKDPS